MYSFIVSLYQVAPYSTVRNLPLKPGARARRGATAVAESFELANLKFCREYCLCKFAVCLAAIPSATALPYARRSVLGKLVE